MFYYHPANLRIVFIFKICKYTQNREMEIYKYKRKKLLIRLKGTRASSKQSSNLRLKKKINKRKLGNSSLYYSD
jgi:hypothetical protein